MFFGKRRKKKGPESLDETWAGDDFGFDAESDSGPPPTKAPAEPSYEPDEDFSHGRGAPADRDERSDPSEGRSLDDVTFVSGRPATDPSPPLAPSHSAPQLPAGVPSTLGTGGDEEELPDATMFIGAPADLRTLTVAWLVVGAGDSRGRDYRLQDQTTCVGGSPESDIRLTDEYASSRHAEIRVANGQYVLHDLKSTNGTFRNDDRVQQVVLQDGDRIRFGLSDFVFKCVEL